MAHGTAIRTAQRAQGRAQRRGDTVEGGGGGGCDTAAYACDIAQGAHRFFGCTVHLTQFLTQCTISVTFWTTVHEHCSHDF